MDHSSLLKDVGVSILTAAVLAFPCYLLRIPLLLAYLAAGVLLGPHLGFSIIDSHESISTLSEIGLILLMFILGLEININKLLQAGKAVLVNGVTQFVGCALLGFGFFRLLGFTNANGMHELTYLAVAASLSSTLVVVKILSDRMELDTLTSRISLGILVLQDLWAIAFLAVQPNLSNLEASALALSGGKAALLVLSGAGLSRFFLPWIFAKAGKQPELLVVLAMAWCATMCGLAEMLKLSLEMGALAAGIVIASFPYHADIASKVSALRDFFITLFFVSLGLQIPKPTTELLSLTGALVAFVLFSRVLTVFPVLHFLRYGNRASLVPAINLSQLSEFGLVLAALGVQHNHVSANLLSAVILAMVTSALISSALIPHAHTVYRFLNPLLLKLGFKDEVLKEDAKQSGHGSAQIVLLGFFREASSFLHEMLERHSDEARKKILVVDFNPEAHRKLNEIGVHCAYGDLSHPDTLKHLDLSESQILICSIPDHFLKGTSNLNLLRVLKEMAPQAHIIVTAQTIASARELYDQGASYVLLPRLLNARFLADLVDHYHTGTQAGLVEESKAKIADWNEVLP